VIDVSSLVISIISTIITVGSLVYAIKTNREKKSLERLIHGKLKGIAGNIVASDKSATLADTHFRKCRDKALKLDESSLKNEILVHLHDGARDAESASRMLENLLNEVLSLQNGLFKTRDIVHPKYHKENGTG
jgi:hypothetical protein